MKSFLRYRIRAAAGILAFLLGCTATVTAQPFSNSWINFANTYYKFRVAREGIYRISKAQLDAIGMGSVTGNQFAVYREGKEVPIYTSTAGAFGSGDFIEFYATRADGKMDTELYPDPAFQPSDYLNIISDTAYYFLTFDNSVHQRMQLAGNNIPAPAPVPASYCWATSYPVEEPRAMLAPGRSHNTSGSSYFYSSDFDLGEGYAYGFGTSVSVNIPVNQVYTAGPAATVFFAFASHSILEGPFRPVARLNNSVTLLDTTLTAKFRMCKRSVAVPASALTSSNAQITFSDNYNLYALSASIRYPRNYNFSGAFSSKASFQMPAADRYLEITGLNTGGQPVRLYDRTNGKIYTATESGGVTRFYLDATLLQRDVFLSNEASVSNITVMSQVHFRDYSNTANQGDYIILSHKDYINASPNYIAEYKSYRSSMAGGSFQPVIVDVEELYDQFAYGFEYHPLSIKNFVAYAHAAWTVKPKFMFIIGKGVIYSSYRSYQSIAGQLPYRLVPTWGEPGADNLLSSFNYNQKPTLATGRLSAWNNEEIGSYLSKVRVYEEAVRPLNVPTVDHELWKKKALHIVGASYPEEQAILLPPLNSCKKIFEDSLIGGAVTTIQKMGTDPIEQVNNVIIDSLINRGVGYISYYGHGASSGFAYNLNSPDNYQSRPRFPVFSSFACEVAHIFDLTSTKAISESYINSVNGGAIVMIAGNNTGWTGTLPNYMTGLYRNWSFLNYGKTLGEQYQKNIQGLKDDNPNDTFMDIHLQSLLFQGDPGIALYNPDKPDYAIEDQSLSAIPATVTSAMDSFQVKAVVYNLGKAPRDSVWVRLQHTRPGSNTIYYTDSVQVFGLQYTDTVFFKVPVDPNRDIGLNNYTVKADAAERYDELSEINNQATLQLFIYSENLVPIYPREFAIVHQQGITLKASTLNAFAPVRTYRLEIDTTENFDSPLKQATQVASMGGVIKWQPSMLYQDSVVYYWRAAPDSMINGKYSWSGSSFIFLANGTDGWNQSHYFQYKKDEPYSGIELLPATRKFRFSPKVNTLKVTNVVVGPPVNDYYGMNQFLNDERFDTWGCVFTGSIQIIVIDSTTGEPWRNSTTGPGVGGSAETCNPNHPIRKMFEFSTADPESRNNARRFIDSIPDGNYVVIKNLIYNGPPGAIWNGKTIDDWKADSTLYGPGNTLYHAIKNLGFDMIDQFTSKRVFAFFRRKGVDSYEKSQAISNGVDDKIEFTREFFSYPDTGIVTSGPIGPAKEWKSFQWRISAVDNAPVNDSPYVAVYGIDTVNTETLLYSGFARDTSLSFISAEHYPYLKLKWYSVDNITRTSAYLDYWRVLYTPVPEAALNAAGHFEFTDSLGEGQQGRFRVGIENLTPLPMDSMLVNLKIIDANGVKHDLGSKRYKPLAGNDTLIAGFDLDVSAYHGNNFLFVEANPNGDQPEQYHPNNLGYLPLHVQADKENPLLDVTFDGVHILDKDIVSARPLIKVLLRDENKFLPLADTSLMVLKLLYPNQSVPVEIPMDGTICKFFPAQMVNGQKNEARVEFRPELLEDGVYRLIVSGKDKVGNLAGNAAKYEVNFTVENKPSITNVLNYPNPFSTATQFIFTMTGSEIPSQFKIQILTVTGKVVREIKKHELGNLHIGRNLTEYRWDGRDEYGQLLGNGVYLYRVVTSIRGNEIEHRKNEPVDKFFKNGYGKLYIMR